MVNATKVLFTWNISSFSCMQQSHAKLYRFDFVVQKSAKSSNLFQKLADHTQISVVLHAELEYMSTEPLIPEAASQVARAVFQLREMLLWGGNPSGDEDL